MEPSSSKSLEHIPYLIEEYSDSNVRYDSPILNQHQSHTSDATLLSTSPIAPPPSKQQQQQQQQHWQDKQHKRKGSYIVERKVHKRNHKHITEYAQIASLYCSEVL